MLQWGAGNVSATTTARALWPSWQSALAPTTPIPIPLSRAGTLQRLRVHVENPGGNGLPVVYTVAVNGVPTALTVSLASTGTDASDLVNTVPVLAGDLVTLLVTKAASVGTGPMDVVATCEFA
jgi:hypothetical protein